MSTLIKETEVETVGELREFLSGLPDGFPVYDAVGELLCVRIYEEDGGQFMEVA